MTHVELVAADPVDVAHGLNLQRVHELCPLDQPIADLSEVFLDGLEPSLVFDDRGGQGRLVRLEAFELLRAAFEALKVIWNLNGRHRLLSWLGLWDVPPLLRLETGGLGV